MRSLRMRRHSGYRFSMTLVPILLAALSYCASAAVPEVALETDPMTISCVTQGAGTLTASGAAVSATSISGAGIYLYQAAYNAASGSGSLKKFRLGFDGADGAIRKASSADWDAADILTGTSSSAQPAPNLRRIYTAGLAADQRLRTMPFLWGELSAAQQTMLHTYKGIDDQLGAKRLDYLRGGRRYELGQADGIFRARDRLLGAIVHAAPLFVGAPDAAVRGPDYQAFYDAVKTRRPVVYVGAADGMLHAFAADTGEELFAYIPQALLHRLAQLTAVDYVYRPYVDGAPAVAEARLGQQWKSVLVAGMGGSAQGVFALDVTQPEQFERGLGALWEFTDADDADIGHVLGAPLIAKLKVGVSKGVSIYRYFAVVASGLNNYRDDGAGKFNAQASGALFLLALDKPGADKWLAGVNYFKFLVPISDKDMANGMMAPSAVLAADGAVSHVYAGDLQGNLWRFNFSGNAPWSNAMGAVPLKPLFAASDAQRNRQPITQKVQVVFAADDAYLVLFGTGKFLEDSDLDRSRFKSQSFYAILDVLDSKTVMRSQLTERKLAATNAGGNALEISGSAVRYGAPGVMEKGWYVDFPDAHKSGERSIASAHIADGNLFFNTYLPADEPCRQGSGRSYMLNALTGLSAYVNPVPYLTPAGALYPPLLMATMAEQAPARDASGKRRVKKKLGLLDPAAENTEEAAQPGQKNTVDYFTSAGRLSWRELVNWLELRASGNRK